IQCIGPIKRNNRNAVFQFIVNGFKAHNQMFKKLKFAFCFVFHFSLFTLSFSLFTHDALVNGLPHGNRGKEPYAPPSVGTRLGRASRNDRRLSQNVSAHSHRSRLFLRGILYSAAAPLNSAGKRSPVPSL
ncbi:MAG TPA: hypothetical protein VMS29_08915, partial [Pyrinomonadaceae bacterium]|nr:hypothetical protein [Pyrinomonadaceae bacterium]